MNLSNLRVGDAIVLNNARSLRLCEIVQVLAKAVEIRTAELSDSPLERFSKVSGKHLYFDGQSWVLSEKSVGYYINYQATRYLINDELSIAVPTPEQLATLPGYKGNSIETAIRRENEATIARIHLKVDAFLDPNAEDFHDRVLQLKNIVEDAHIVEPRAESYIDAIARLERDKQHLQSKLDSIQEILQG